MLILGGGSIIPKCYNSRMQFEQQSNETPQEIVRRLKEFMDSRGLNNVMVAESLQTPPSTVRHWFTIGDSRSVPTTSNIQKILLLLGTDEESHFSMAQKMFKDLELSNGPGESDENQSMTTDNKSNSARATEEKSPTYIASKFANTEHFQDEVYGEIFLSPLERDLIDTPEFQRLYRVSQLGFIDLVYQSANHNRGQHSIGVCEAANQLVGHLNENSQEAAKKLRDQLERNGESPGDDPPPPLISPSEKVLIRLGGLLHDIPHAPFSHDIEKKTHYVYRNSLTETPHKLISYYGGYDKHDDLERNPTFYISMFDSDVSVLARVLKNYSEHFWGMLQSDAEDSRYAGHLAPFVQAVKKSNWPDVEFEILPNLLFHLIAFERPMDGIDDWHLNVADQWGGGNAAHTREWGLGPKAFWKELHQKWYQPFRHDIVGNTLSADLIDYLQRDLKRLGIDRGIDLNLLNHYVLAPIAETFKDKAESSGAKPNITLFRCAIDLNDYKRGTIREYLLNDVFRLLDLRHEIHEKAVNHRVVHAAVAMLSRTLLQLEKEEKPLKPLLKEIVGAESACSANYGEESFLMSLIDLMPGKPGSMDKLNSLPQKIAERRIYRPLMIIPGDVAVSRMLGLDQVQAEIPLRKLAAIVDSQLFSPFFLFLSYVVQVYLQHGFENEDDFWKYITNIASEGWPDEKVTTAMAFVPKRVIVSATPYKQLYKDPALVVRVDKTVGQIDELRHRIGRSEISTRIDAAMGDAEQKYAGMWKLFVFISDGLYYTGTAAKIVPEYPCGTRIDAHLDCLRFAQTIFISGFKTAYVFWKEIKEPHSPRALGEDLKQREFQSLLRTFLAMTQMETELHQGSQNGLSGIDLKWYLHGDDTDNCKDVRYKFDVKSTLDLDKISLGPDKDLADAAEALKSFNLAEGRLLDRETREFMERYQATATTLKTTISSEVKKIQEQQALTGSRFPVPSQNLKRAIHQIYRDDIRKTE